MYGVCGGGGGGVGKGGAGRKRNLVINNLQCHCKPISLFIVLYFFLSRPSVEVSLPTV